MTKLAFQDLVERLRDWAGSNHDPSSPVKEPVALATEAADLIEQWGETLIPDLETNGQMLEARINELEAMKVEPALLDRLIAAAKIIDNGAKLLDGFDGFVDLDLASRVKDHVADCEAISKDWRSVGCPICGPKNT